MIKAAYLRVYVPGDGSHEQSEPAPPRLREVSEYGLMSESLNDGVLVVDWNNTQWVCPRHPRLRLLEGLLGFRNAYPGLTAELCGERAQWI